MMLTVSEARLASMVSLFFPNPDDSGPYDPRALVLGRLEPNPSPWHLATIVELIKTARALEASNAGAGASFIERVLEDPDDWCPTYPHRPRPKPHHLDPDELLGIGATFVALADGIPEQQLAGIAREGGAKLMAQASGG
jgi:hypothetical protein